MLIGPSYKSHLYDKYLTLLKDPAAILDKGLKSKMGDLDRKNVLQNVSRGLHSISDIWCHLLDCDASVSVDACCCCYRCRFAALLAHQYPDHVSKLVMMSVGAPVPLSPYPGCLCLPVCCLMCLRPVLVSTLMRF